jgi:hypothetical protein
MDRVEDVPQVEAAMRLLQNMLDKKFICHASGNPSFPFRNGLHFYFIVQPNTPKPGLAAVNHAVKPFQEQLRPIPF